MPKALKPLSRILFPVILLLAACSISPESKPAGSIPPSPFPLEETAVPETIKERTFEIQYPNWISFTNANAIQELAFDQEGYLWAVGDGGAVKWDLEDGSYEKITSEYGLAENHLTSLAIAPDGSLWFGSDSSGVSRFDGQEWRIFTEEDGLVSNSIHDIAVSENNAVWVATPKGVSQYDGTQWKTITTADGLMSDMVYTLLMDSNNTPWFGTNAGLSHLDGVIWSHFSPEDGLGGRLIRCLLEGSDGSLWVGTQDAGLSRFDGETWQTYTEGDGLPSDWIYSLAEDSNGRVWIGTRKGLSYLEDQTLITDGNDPVSGVPITTLVIGEDGIPLAGTADSGFYMIYEEQVTPYLTRDSLPNNNIEGLGISVTGSILVLTEDGTISHFQSNNWETVSSVDPKLMPVKSAPLGFLWFQDLEGGVSSFGGESWLSYPNPDLAKSLITSISTAGNDVWVTTSEDGVYQFANNQWTNYRSTNGLAHDRVTSSSISPNGDVWFGTEAKGISRYKNGDWITYTTEDGLADNAVFSLTSSPSGTVWAGTDAGISRFDGEIWTFYVGEEFSGILDLFVSQKPLDVLWVGGMDGVLSFDGEKWQHYPPEVGLAGGIVKTIIESKGWLWFGTLQAGLSSYLPTAFQYQGLEAEGIREVILVDIQEIQTTTGSPPEGYQGPEFLQLGNYQMEWSDCNETSGYLHFRDHQTMFSMWEFRPSDKTEISQVELYEVQAPFYGRTVPAGETAFGRDWGDNVIRVSVGEIVLARIYNEWDIVYILKIAEIDGRTVIVDYAMVEVERDGQ
jgi:ligand-binding sensor domain-containing protein